MTTDDGDCELEYTHNDETLGGKGSSIQTNDDLNNSSLAATQQQHHFQSLSQSYDLTKATPAFKQKLAKVRSDAH